MVFFAPQYIMHLPMEQYEMLGLATKYGLTVVQGQMSSVRDAMWFLFRAETPVLRFYVFCKGL